MTNLPTRSVGAGETVREPTAKQLRRFFDLSVDMLCIAGMDGRFKLLSPAWEYTLGYSRDEMLATPFMEFVHPDDRQATVSELESLVRGKTTFRFENRYRCANGKYVWLSWTSSPQAEEGLLYSVARDITEERRFREVLQESERRFASLADTAPVLIWMSDADGQCTYFNKQWLDFTGRSFEQERGVGWLESVHPDDYSGCREAYRSANQVRGPFTVEFRLLSTEGEYRWVLGSGVPRFGPDKECQGFIGTCIDITARKQAEEERVRLEERSQSAKRLESLGMLAGGVAHDFNNLLMGILGNTDLMLSELPADSPMRSYVEHATSCAKRAAELCNQMLAYSGKGRFVIKAFDLSTVMQDTADLLRVNVHKKISLDYEFSSPAVVEADLNQVRQIAMNLITNASEAIGNQAGKIVIATGAMEIGSGDLVRTYSREALPPGRYAYLEVRDTGCGMDPEVQNKIFDPFFTTKFTGRGLGLAAVLGIVRGHSGDVRIESVPGQGTRVRILLPWTKLPAESVSDDALEQEDWWGSGTVLVVDDEDTVRSLAQRMLERRGFQVLSASDGFEALQVYRQSSEPIRLILLDMTMPNMDGEETLKELRKIDPRVKVLLTSGYSEQAAASCFADGVFADFIQKPYTMSDLFSQVRSLLEA